MERVLVLVLISCLCGCDPGKTGEPAVQQQTDTALVNDTAHVAPIQQDTIADATVNRQTGNEIHLSFMPGSDSLLVKGHLDSVGRTVTCYVTINSAKKLSGNIETAKPNTNIRFNQVVFPDKQSDGPFGKELNYDLPKKGTYKIIIGASLMAEKAYTGDFVLHIQLK